MRSAASFVLSCAPLAALAPALLLLTACSRPETAADRHMAAMGELLSEVQADQDRVGKGFLAADADAPRNTAATATSPVPVGPGSPAPRSVQLGGDDSSENDDPNDATPRPEIRVAGVAGAGSRASRLRRGDDARESRESSPIRVDGQSVLDPEAKRAYESALRLVHDKSYDRALEALSAFLVRWPDHPYVENATYWRGECLFARGEYLKAAEQFEAVLTRFGGGNKAPDALLKMGIAHEKLGARDRAQEYWERLKRDYPRSDAARKIPGAASEGSRGKGPKESR